MRLIPNHPNWRVIAYAIRDAWPFGLLVTGIAGAALLGHLTSRDLPDTVRFAGTALQVFGLLVVALGLRSMRELFGRPSVAASVVGFFERLAAAFRPGGTAYSHVTLGGMTAGGTGRSIFRPGPTSSTKRRLALLEQAVEELRNELDAQARDIRNSIAAVNKSLEKEELERRDENVKFKKLLDEVAVGGLHLESIGLVWLILGVVGTSIPSELARLIAFIA